MRVYIRDGSGSVPIPTLKHERPALLLAFFSTDSCCRSVVTSPDTAGWSGQDRIIQVFLSHQGWTDGTLCGTQRDGEEEIKEEDNRMKKDHNKK